MPNKSIKQHVIDLTNLITIHGLVCPEEQILTDEEMLVCSLSLQEFRYLSPRTFVPKSAVWTYSILMSPEFDDSRFRQHIRMDKASFSVLLNTIKDDPIFTSNRTPVEIQLAVALNCMGTSGNGSSYGVIAAKYGVSEGSVENFVNRIITVLNSISPAWIRWPDKEERMKLGSTLAQDFLPKCIGFVDGSDAHFYQAPTTNKECYWPRKKKCCMQFQIVCDQFRRIRHLYTGFPGSVHDARVYSTCQLSLNPAEFFSPGEFIIGDSAYASSETVIVPFKRNGGNLNKEKRKFNRHVSSKRVFVEHTIGILKGRWQSLLSLRINVNERNGHLKVCQWINACAVLHNFLMHRDPWNHLDDFIYSENEEIFEQEDMIDNIANHKRMALCAIINSMI